MMVENIDAPPSYVRGAFFVQYNVILLGGAALFSLASASLFPLLAGLVAEGAWLLVGPRIPAFRRWVDTTSLRRAAMGSEDRDSFVIAGLEGAYSARVRRFVGVTSEIHQVVRTITRRKKPRYELQVALARLDELEPAFIRSCEEHQRLSGYLTATPEEALKEEVSRLAAASAAERDLGARVTLRQSQKLAERRVEDHERVVQQRRAAELKLQMLEAAASHVRSRSILVTEELELARVIQELVPQVGGGGPRDRDEGSQAAIAVIPGRRPAPS